MKENDFGAPYITLFGETLGKFLLTYIQLTHYLDRPFLSFDRWTISCIIISFLFYPVNLFNAKILVRDLPKKISVSAWLYSKPPHLSYSSPRELILCHCACFIIVWCVSHDASAIYIVREFCYNSIIPLPNLASIIKPLFS